MTAVIFRYGIIAGLIIGIPMIVGGTLGLLAFKPYRPL